MASVRGHQSVVGFRSRLPTDSGFCFTRVSTAKWVHVRWRGYIWGVKTPKGPNPCLATSLHKI